MKKFRGLFFLLAFLLLPILVYADGTTYYYIEANVLSNGDMQVKEVRLMNGSYNGYLVSLKYKNSSLKNFTGDLNDFDGSGIYNSSGLQNIKVYDATVTKDKYKIINEFRQVSSAKKGDYGVYTKSEKDGGADLTAYLPSSYNRAILITYTLRDVVVVHNDIAEIAWDFIGNDYQETINNLLIKINLPNDSRELRVFSHGPLNGENRIIDSKSVEVKYDFLNSHNAVDARVVFDKSIVPTAIKMSGVNGLDNILSVEKARADKANKERKRARELEKEREKQSSIYRAMLIAWFFGLIVLVYRFYKKYDREFEAEFKAKYLRDFPSEYLPTTVSYLMSKKINNNSFGACVLDLIRKKALILEKITTGSSNKNDYKLIANDNFDLSTLAPNEKILYDLLMKMGNNRKCVTLKQIKTYTTKYSDASTFMTDYNLWRSESLEFAKEEEIFEESIPGKPKYILYAVLFFIMLFFGTIMGLDIQSCYWVIPFDIGALIYFLSATKRTKKGNEEYHKWKALKRFLKDFGRLNEKDLPEVVLWEKYLVYATVFGIATKVQKAMKINLDKLNYTDSDLIFTYLYFDNYNFYRDMNKVVNNSVYTARQTISEHEAARSSNSSSGGFGGGSSFGGGGFGGGGSGGGRF